MLMEEDGFSSICMFHIYVIFNVFAHGAVPVLSDYSNYTMSENPVAPAYQRIYSGPHSSDISSMERFSTGTGCISILRYRLKENC